MAQNILYFVAILYKVKKNVYSAVLGAGYFYNFI